MYLQKCTCARIPHTTGTRMNLNIQMHNTATWILTRLYYKAMGKDSFLQFTPQVDCRSKQEKWSDDTCRRHHRTSSRTQSITHLYRIWQVLTRKKTPIGVY